MLNNDLYQRIEEALKQIRPFLEADGGDVLHGKRVVKSRRRVAGEKGKDFFSS